LPFDGSSLFLGRGRLVREEELESDEDPNGDDHGQDEPLVRVHFINPVLGLCERTRPTRLAVAGPRGNRIQSARMKGVAPAKTPNDEPTTSEPTVLLERLDGIARTARMKPAGCWQEWR
jgi:hypothetical protein